MNNKRAYKTDESFLEKISIGAIGTKKVYQDLENRGHFPIELERSSTSFKIWKEIKIKRVRVPDILCINCGTRVESRAKTKLEMSMSHSLSNQERGWDFGLQDTDFVALVKCVKTGDRPIDWFAYDLIQYLPVSELRKAFNDGKVTSEKPKGATEGFEVRLTWPSAIANSDGVISNINDEKIQFKRVKDNRIVTLKLIKKINETNVKLSPTVKLDEQIGESQIIACIAPVFREIGCKKDHTDKDYIEMLNSPSLSDRYAAAKALPYFESKDSIANLIEKMNDEREHIYVRLEAASSLLKMGQRNSISFFEKVLNDSYLANRLEGVIILSEINRDESCDLLVKTLLDQNQHPEIRAGAAWSLGELGNKQALDTLVNVFNDVEMNIKIEAARALVKLNESFAKEVMKFILKSNEQQRAGLSWSLSKSGNFSLPDLMPLMVDNDARKWIAWIIGTQKEERYINQIEELKNKDAEVYFAVTVLWKILSSWVNGLEVY